MKPSLPDFGNGWLTWLLRSALVLGLNVAGWSSVAATVPDTFTNPIVSTGADPWVIQKDGFYYFCHASQGGLGVSRTRDLTQIGSAPFSLVWSPASNGPCSRNIWAPELHHLRGRWYIYFAADDGRNENHRMFVLEGDAMDPQKPFHLKGKVASADDHWAIDGTVLRLPTDELYFIWSGWEGTNNVAQNLYLAPLADPWTISGPRVCLSRPERDWEVHGTPRVNEGPEVLWHGTNLFVIYSASGSWTDRYCLGQLRFMGGSVSESKNWVKHPRTVFEQNEFVWGPGHASFVKSPDGREDWIVYHAAQRRGSGWKRDIRLQPFNWNPDSTPDFGQPVRPGTFLSVPAGTLTR